MADLLATGLAWLAGQLKSNASETITYTRGTQSITIQATLAMQLMRTTDAHGNTKIERPDADFIITAADINFGAGQVEPATADVITRTYGSVNKQFRLLPMNNGAEPAWRYCDPFQTMVRCHTKFIGDA